MNRRGFLKGLLGAAAAAALPAGALDALAKNVALPGEQATHTLSLWVRATTATTLNANGKLVPIEAKDGWQRIVVPMAVPELKKGETFTISWGTAEMQSFDLHQVTLEEGGPTTPYKGGGDED